MKENKTNTTKTTKKAKTASSAKNAASVQPVSATTPAKVKRGRGRPANKAWESINVGSLRLMTVKQIQEKLAAAGFQTSYANIYLRIKRLAAKGKNVLCERSRKLVRKEVTVDVPAANTTESPTE